MSVGAVNKQTGERIPTAGMPAVDSVLSGTSTNPVQNRVVKGALDEKADTDMVAADFNAGTSYTAGNYCVQDGKLYKFKNNHSGAWSSADVDEVKITGELSALKSGLNNLVKSETMTVTTDSSGGASFDLPSGGTILVSIRPLRDADYYNLWWGVTIGSRAYNSGYGFKAIKDDGTALVSQAIKFDVCYI